MKPSKKLTLLVILIIAFVTLMSASKLFASEKDKDFKFFDKSERIIVLRLVYNIDDDAYYRITIVYRTISGKLEFGGCNELRIQASNGLTNYYNQGKDYESSDNSRVFRLTDKTIREMLILSK